MGLMMDLQSTTTNQAAQARNSMRLQLEIIVCLVAVVVLFVLVALIACLLMYRCYRSHHQRHQLVAEVYAPEVRDLEPGNSAVLKEFQNEVVHWEAQYNIGLERFMCYLSKRTDVNAKKKFFRFWFQIATAKKSECRLLEQVIGNC